MTKVDVFHAGAAFEASILQPPLKRAVLPPVPLPVDQQPQALLEAEPLHIRIFLLLAEGLGHAAQPQGMQFFYGLLVEHVFPLSNDGGRLGRIKVARTANVVVLQRQPRRRRLLERHAVQVPLQHRLHALIGAGPQLHGTLGRRLHAGHRVLLG